MKSIGERVNRARESRGISREAPGKAIGLSKGVVYNRENGIGKFTDDEILKIAKYLGVPVESLIERPGTSMAASEAFDMVNRLLDMYAVAEAHQLVDVAYGLRAPQAKKRNHA